MTPSGRLLGAAPLLLLVDDKLQDQLGRATGPLHDHGVTTVLQKVQSTTRHHLRNDRSSRHIHHLDGKSHVSLFYSKKTMRLLV